MSVAYKFRITLWDNTGTNKWRGAQTALIFDAKNIGAQEFANSPGSAYWTLSNDHPQIATHIPLSTHYEISRWSDVRSRWEFVAAGMLNNYQTNEYETVFSGIDYKNILNNIFTPISGMTTGDATVINSTLTTASLNRTVSQYFTIAESTATTAIRYITTSAVVVSPITAIGISGPILQISAPVYDDDIGAYITYINDPDGETTYWQAPMVLLRYQVKYVGSSTRLDDNCRIRIYCYPEVARDQGEPPLGNAGIIAQYTLPVPLDQSATTTVWQDQSVYFATKELQDAIEAAGYYFTGQTILQDWEIRNSNIPAPLRNGLSYGFQIYAAIENTTTTATPNIIYRSEKGGITSTNVTTGTIAEVVVGQSQQNAAAIINNAFTNATQYDVNSRLKYATLSISGTTTSEYPAFSAGEQTLDYIASICDIEMGIKTTNERVVFGITKPVNGGSYNGTFKLNLSVSSTATTAFALKYPETIKSFNFDPGYSRVKNKITVIPYGRYYNGLSGANVDGISTIGSEASDSASINQYGTIEAFIPRSGFIDSTIASAEASRLLNAYSPNNTKSVGLNVVLDSIDIWNGWDLGDSVRVTINQGLVSIDEAFVISGVTWTGETNGTEIIKLELVQGSAFNASR